VVLAPAMHTEMWEHPATRANRRAAARARDVVVEPAVGRLTGADSGKGRLPDPDELFAVCAAVLARGSAPGRPSADGGSCVGRRHARAPRTGALPGNRSERRQGHALARTAVARGAEVVLVTASSLPDVAGAEVVRVTSAQQLADAVLAAAPSADAVVMAAAVADYRPVERLPVKRKKTDSLTVELVQNPDVLAELGAAGATARCWSGFAAETGDADATVLDHGRAKLARKGCDLLVVNEVGEPRAPHRLRGRPERRGGARRRRLLDDVPLGSKDALADAVWDLVVAPGCRASAR
jgi:phosphopantothenoylcysteine decarboxylase/phosphopantothenate--cysteine ligase